MRVMMTTGVQTSQLYVRAVRARFQKHSAVNRSATESGSARVQLGLRRHEGGRPLLERL